MLQLEFRPMASIPWRLKQLAGGTQSPFERATSRLVSLKQQVEQRMRTPGTDQNELHRLLTRSQRVKRVVEAQRVLDPVVTDPRKTAKPNTGRVSKPGMPGAPRRGGSSRAG